MEGVLDWAVSFEETFNESLKHLEHTVHRTLVSEDAAGEDWHKSEENLIENSGNIGRIFSSIAVESYMERRTCSQRTRCYS